MKNRKILFVGLTLMLAALFAACGRNDPTQTPFVVTATPLPTAVVVTAPPVTVVVPVTVTPKGPTAVIPTAQPNCPGAPTIEFFVANPVNIIHGQTTVLQWGQVLNATAVGIDNGIGGVPAPGQSQVSPAQTTTYTMIATGCGGQLQKQVTVTVQNPTGVPPTNVPPTNVPPTNVPPTAEPTNVPPTAAPCKTEITGVNVTAPQNPGTQVNATATECYDGSQGDNVVVVATALDAAGNPVVGVSAPTENAGTNKQKTVNLSITMLLGAQPPPSTQVQLCFQTPAGEKFGCVSQSFAMTWQ